MPTRRRHARGEIADETEQAIALAIEEIIVAATFEDDELCARNTLRELHAHLERHEPVRVAVCDHGLDVEITCLAQRVETVGREHAPDAERNHPVHKIGDRRER
jgi:hypothetical protein